MFFRINNGTYFKISSMKKYLFILILSLPFSLMAQNYYVISDTTATNLKQYKITWFYGVDPVQLKSGEWILSEECYKIAEQFIDKPIVIAEKAAYFRQTVNEYPIRVLRKEDFKEPELELIK